MTDDAKYEADAHSVANVAPLRLSANLRSRWDTDGYLHLPAVLDDASVERLRAGATALLGDVEAGRSASGNSVSGNRVLGAHAATTFNVLQVIETSNAFDSLLDEPRLFPLIVDLMTPYLQVAGIDLFVRHPASAVTPLHRFHTDGGPSMQKFLPTPGNPPLLIKAQFFLTDTTAVRSGNMLLVPGSHRRRVTIEDQNCLVGEARDAIEVRAAAGDVVIHAWTLWHATGQNTTENTRLSVSVRYMPLWARPHYKCVAPATLARLTPRQRRLLGDLGGDEAPTEFYTPPNQRALLIDEHWGKDADAQ